MWGCHALDLIFATKARDGRVVVGYALVPCSTTRDRPETNPIRNPEQLGSI